MGGVCHTGRFAGCSRLRGPLGGKYRCSTIQERRRIGFTDIQAVDGGELHRVHVAVVDRSDVACVRWG
jgi:hypothetical protein